MGDARFADSDKKYDEMMKQYQEAVSELQEFVRLHPGQRDCRLELVILKLHESIHDFVHLYDYELEDDRNGRNFFCNANEKEFRQKYRNRYKVPLITMFAQGRYVSRTSVATTMGDLLYTMSRVPR